ncbi:MAG TPA: toll/interleukin-1 receptor domain-containing protein [Methanoregula sp.]|nr:toll/interleukin-1 receptor domain-containing protein [Methanoregula sp.]
MAEEPPRTNPGHHDVFISYAQQDKPVADAVCAKLESRNIRCWIAPRDIPPGKNFLEAIIEGIDEGKVVVVIFSSFANKSPHVMRELTNAVNKGRIIIPFRIEDVIPSKSMEYLIGVPHWLDAVSPPLEEHIDLLAGTVQSIIYPDQKPDSSLNAAPMPGNLYILGSPAPAPPIPPPPSPSPGLRPPHPGTGPKHHPGRSGRIAAYAGRHKTAFAGTGIIIAALILLVFGMQAGMYNPGLLFPAAPNPVNNSSSAFVDYRGSNAAVNTVVLTTEPTQTLAPGTELSVIVSKDDSDAVITVLFNGGPGMGLVKDNQVILTRSDGTVMEDKLNFDTRLSEVTLQGTRGTDRVRVIVTLYSGSVKTIVDTLVPYRTYH